jgi:hypothetical protein
VRNSKVTHTHTFKCCLFGLKATEQRTEVNGGDGNETAVVKKSVKEEKGEKINATDAIP